MVMSLALDFWETLSLSAGCNLLAPKFKLCVSNVQKAHAAGVIYTNNSAAMRFSDTSKSLVPLETFLIASLPKLLLSLTILGLNGLLLLLRKDTQEFQSTTRALLRSLLVLYAGTALFTIYAEISIALFLFWEIRIWEEQGKECVIINSALIGASVGISIHMVSLALDWTFLRLPQYRQTAHGAIPLWILALWIPTLILTGLPIGGWKTDFTFCLFLLQFKPNFLQFVGGIHLSSILLCVFLPIMLKILIRSNPNPDQSRWKRKLQNQQRRTILIILTFHVLTTSPFNLFLLFLPSQFSNSIVLHFLFIPSLIPPVIVPLLLAIRSNPPLPPPPKTKLTFANNKNPLGSANLFFLDSTRLQHQSKSRPITSQHHFFSSHYLPVDGGEVRTPSVHSYATISSHDTKYGFPIKSPQLPPSPPPPPPPKRIPTNIQNGASMTTMGRSRKVESRR